MLRAQKGLHELADRGHLNHFLKLGKEANHNYSEIKTKDNDNSDRNTKTIVMIIGGIDSKKLNA